MRVIIFSGNCEHIEFDTKTHSHVTFAQIEKDIRESLEYSGDLTFQYNFKNDLLTIELDEKQ